MNGMTGAEPYSFSEGEDTDAGCSEFDGLAGAEPDLSPEGEGTDVLKGMM